jgi:hypothetical protein
VALDFGRVIADGRPDEVLGSRLVHTAYFGAAAEEEAVIQHVGDEALGAGATERPPAGG